jgi:hypothetical protein
MYRTAETLKFEEDGIDFLFKLGYIERPSKALNSQELEKLSPFQCLFSY